MKNQKGFTLIEVAFVIAIIGALIAFFAPSGTSTWKDAEKLSVTTAVSTLTSAEGMYIARKNTLPAAATAIQDLISDGEINGDVLKSIKIGTSAVHGVGAGNVVGGVGTIALGVTTGGNGYDLTGNGTIDTVSGENVSEIQILGVTPAQAAEISLAIDGVSMSQVVAAGAVVADVKGRVEHPAILSGATGNVSVFLQRY